MLIEASDAAVLFTVAICFFARPIGVRLRVIDHPDDARKHHPLPTPQVGGIAIMAAVLAAAAIGLAMPGVSAHSLYVAILCCGGGIAIVGFMDDQHTISASARLVLLALFSFIAIKFDPALITDRIGTVTFGAVPISPGLFLPFILIVLVGFASAVNMLDGLTGLVMGLFCVWAGCLTLTGGEDVERIAQAVAGGSLVTLLFNLRGRLFLGDCGTFAIAFVIGLLTIDAHNAGRLPAEVIAVWFFLPIADCLRLIPVRLYMGRSPFRPDKNHFHHLIAARFNNRIALVVCGAVVGLTSLVATLLPSLAIVCFAILIVLYVGFLLVDAFAWDTLFRGTVFASRSTTLLRATRVLSAAAAPRAQTLPGQMQRALRKTLRAVPRNSPQLRRTLARVVSRNPRAEIRDGYPQSEPITEPVLPVGQVDNLALDFRNGAQRGAHLPQKWGPLLQYRSTEGGIIALSFISTASQKVSFLLRDRFGNMHSVAPIEVTTAPLRDVNLVTSEAPHDAWLVAIRSPGVTSGKNLNAERMAGEDDTYFVSSLKEEEDSGCVATATLLDPITRGDIPIRGGVRYKFSILAAVDDSVASVRLGFKTSKGNVEGPTQVIKRMIGGDSGGSKLHSVEVEFVAPENAVCLLVDLDKGRSETLAKSHLFFARPSLQEISEDAPGNPITLASDLLQQVRSGEVVSITQALLESPPEMLDGRSGRAAIHARFGQEQIVIPDVIMESGRVVEVTGLTLENNSISFSGRFKNRNADPVKLGLYVDGVLSASQEFGVVDRAFRGSMILDNKHLDGQPHRIELRLFPQMLVLGSLYEILPMQITPWSILQLHARPPLDAALAPAARHHLRSYQLWFERIQLGVAGRLPPLAALHSELLQGFKKRSNYPVLEFDKCANPRVSIIVPAHNKFEVTYFCLCALQFAFNDTLFEIIVVDDGSTDETVRTSDFVKGIGLVRHEQAQGFVQACNAGAAAAKGEFVAFLNNDTEVTARWLDELVSTFENFENVGLVGSKLVYPDGQLQEAGGIVWGNGNPWNVGRNGNPVDPRYNYLRQADYLSGAAIMLRRDLWKSVGGFSAEMAPAYFEDTDLAMKVREAGLRVVYVPTSTVYHFEGQSAGTATTTGMKRFQEINRPKFKRKWRRFYENHGKEGEHPDREKDRNAAFRVLFVDGAFPRVDNDAGSYAAFQEIRLLQSLGGKVTFLPRNLAWMDRHTQALQRIGVECLYAPYVTNFVGYIRSHAAEYDLVYVTRYYVAEQVIPLVRAGHAKTKVIVNLADLHFLRELREAAAGTPGYTLQKAEATREAELNVIRASDLTMSYSDVELAVLESHVGHDAALAKLPWVVEAAPSSRSFSNTKDILFLGGFGHPPNEQAVKFFAGKVMPHIARDIPEARFNVAGSQPSDALRALESDSVHVIGYVEDLDKLFSLTRIFVAPLLAGAGIKGKVLEAIARGVPSVLSPIAAESTGLTDGVDCLIARTPEEWVAATRKLYSDETLWKRIGDAALSTAKARYSFDSGVDAFAVALSRVGIVTKREWGLVYKHARPKR